MIEYEELRADIDHYLMERFKYRKSLVYLTIDNVITTRRNSRVDLYLRIRKVESLFPPDKYVFRYIGIECANMKSGAFTKKLGFNSIDSENYVIIVDNLKSYFSME